MLAQRIRTGRAKRAIFRNDRLTVRAVAAPEDSFTPGVEAPTKARVGSLHLNGHTVLCLAVDAPSAGVKEHLYRIRQVIDLQLLGSNNSLSCLVNATGTCQKVVVG
jgi:hypothetical protein